jgi:hypothetical protein
MKALWSKIFCRSSMSKYYSPSFPLLGRLGIKATETLHLHGYIHCMPNGNVSFEIRLFPLHPGYVRMVCAEARVVNRAISDRIRGNIMMPADKDSGTGDQSLVDSTDR